MPCTKCKDNKYKWGETGECEYATKEACESANHKYKMQPTPLGKTYEQYEKELKEFNLSKVEKVNLSLLTDIEKSTNKITSFLKNYKGVAKELVKAADVVKNARVLNDEGYDLHNEGTPAFREFVMTAKELGIKADEVPEIKAHLKVSAELSELNSKILKLLPR